MLHSFVCCNFRRSSLVNIVLLVLIKRKHFKDIDLKTIMGCLIKCNRFLHKLQKSQALRIYKYSTIKISETRIPNVLKFIQNCFKKWNSAETFPLQNFIVQFQHEKQFYLLINPCSIFQKIFHANLFMEHIKCKLFSICNIVEFWQAHELSIQASRSNAYLINLVDWIVGIVFVYGFWILWYYKVFTQVD